MADDKRTLEQNISLQMEGAIGSLKSLRSEIKQVTDSWKLQHAQLKQNGENEEAYRVKVDGLAQAIQKQKEGIARLQETMRGISTETKAGVEAHQKLSAEVLKAERNVQSLTNQQTKAQETLRLYESGILDTKKAMEQAENVSKSYEARLRAEGKAVEANQERRRFLTEQIKSLNELYGKEQSELKRIQETSGETSSAYQKQSIRVNELAEKMAKAETEAKGLQKSLLKETKNPFAKINENVNRLRENVNQTNHLFGKMIGANIVSSAIIGGFQRLTGSIHEAFTEGIKFNEEQQVMNATWLTLTSNADKGKAMTDTINQLSVAAGRSRDMVNELEQGFYHLHSNKNESDNLTKSMLNMADAVGLTDDQMKNVTQDMVHGLSTGKLQTGELNQMTQYFPMFGDALLDYEKKVTHNSQLTMEQMRKMTKQGTISAQDVEKVFNELGQDKYGQAADNMLKTMSGMKRTIQSQVPALVGAFEKPIMTAENPFFGAVSKWVSDPKTQKKFQEMGAHAEVGLRAITDAFSKAFGKGGGVSTADSMLDALDEKIQHLSTWLKNNQPKVEHFFETMKQKVSEAWGVVKGAFAGAQAVISPVMGLISKNPKLFFELATAMKVASTGMSALAGGYQTIRTLTSLFGNLAKAGVKSVGSIVKVSQAAGKITANKAAPALSSIKMGLQKAGPAAKDAAKNFSGKLAGALKGLGSGAKGVTTALLGGAKKAGSGLVSAVKKLAGGFKALTVAMMSNPFVAIAAAIIALGLAFYEAYKHNKKFHDMVDKVCKKLKNGFMTAVHYVKEKFGEFVNKIRQYWGDVKGFFSDGVDKVKHILGDMVNGVHNIGVSIGEGLANAIIWGVNKVIDGIDWVSSKITGHKTSIHHYPKVSYERWERGTPSHPGGLMLVNDAQSMPYEELIIRPNGESFIPKGRNVLMNEPAGTQVIPARPTQDFLRSGYFPRYENGAGWIGKAWDKLKGWTLDVFSYLKKPEALIEKVLHKMVSFAGNIGKPMVDFGWDVVKKLGHDAVSLVKKWFSSSSSASAPPGSGAERWRSSIQMAASMLGTTLSDWQVNNLLKQINTESGGDPHAVQNPGVRDINMLMGNPAKGLLQFIPETFSSYALPGHTDIFNGLDQILAAIRRLNAMGTWNYIGQGHGWARGGIVSRHGYYELAEQDAPEMILPLRQDMRTFQLIDKAHRMTGYPQQQTVVQTSTSSEEQGLLREQLTEMKEQNRLLRQLLQVVGGLSQPVERADGLLQKLGQRGQLDNYQGGVRFA